MLSMLNYLLLASTLILTVTGQLCQKQAAITHKGTLIWAGVALCCLAIGLICWLLVLQRLPLSLAYPFLSVNFIVVALCSRFIFKEQIHFINYVGIALIMSGIALLVTQ